MSCETNANKISSANFSAGLARLAAKGAYVRAVRRNIKLARRALDATRRFLAGTPAPTSTAVPELKPVETVSPVTPPAGKTCTECGTATAHPGAWYRLDGQYHCADCAPAAAKRLGVALAVAVPHSAIRLTARNAVSGTYRAPGAVRLQEQPVDVIVGGENGAPPRMVRLEENAFAVLRGDTPTGMALTPAMIDGRPAPDLWAVTHMDTGRAFADGFRDIHEAEGLAALLSQFNWTQPFDAMPQSVLKEAGEIIGRYQAQLTTLRGSLTDRAWRNRDLTGKWVNDGLGDLAMVLEDNGEKLILAGADGKYAMPRNVVQAPSAQAFKDLKLAQPLETATLPSGQVCARCGQTARDTLDDVWFSINAETVCDTCAPDAAAQSAAIVSSLPAASGL